MKLSDRYSCPSRSEDKIFYEEPISESKEDFHSMNTRRGISLLTTVLLPYILYTYCVVTRYCWRIYYLKWVKKAFFPVYSLELSSRFMSLPGSNLLPDYDKNLRLCCFSIINGVQIGILFSSDIGSKVLIISNYDILSLTILFRIVHSRWESSRGSWRANSVYRVSYLTHDITVLVEWWGTGRSGRQHATPPTANDSPSQSDDGCDHVFSTAVSLRHANNTSTST